MSLKLFNLTHSLHLTPYFTPNLSASMECRFLRLRYHFFLTVPRIFSRVFVLVDHATSLSCNGISLIRLLIKSISSSYSKERLTRALWRANSTIVSSTSYSGDFITPGNLPPLLWYVSIIKLSLTV